MGLSHTVSEIDGDFSQKLPIFSTPCILPPLTELPLELGIGAGVRKNRNNGLQDGPKVLRQV